MLTAQTVLLHIGMPKTASSSIQTALAATREQLINGPDPILYPLSGTVPHKLAHHLLGWEYTTLTDAEPTPVTDKVMEEIASAPGSRAIISSEHFPRCKPAVVRDRLLGSLPDGYQPHVVAYARSPATAVLSLIDQEVARQWEAKPFDELIRHYASDFFLYRVITSWDEALPEQMTVRLFDRDKLAEGNAVADFFNMWVGPDHAASMVARDMPPANTGRSAALVLLMDRTRPLVREALADIPDACSQNANRLMRFVTDALMPATEGRTTKLRWSREHLELCYDSSIDGLRELDARWFGEPLLAADMERAMAEVPKDATLLTAEEVLGLTPQEVRRVCRRAARKSSNRFRRVLEKTEQKANRA